jgi:hypothetical protein
MQRRTLTAVRTFYMKANSLKPAFLIYLAFSVAACRSGVARPNIGLDVSVLPKVVSISSKFSPPQPEYNLESDTTHATLPSMVE